MRKFAPFFLLLNWCTPEEPPVQDVEPVAQAVVAEAPVAEKAPEVPVVEAEPAPPPKPKPKPLTHDRCQRINRQFIMCGWKCIRGRGDVGYCVNSCNHFLTKRGWKCLHTWGPGFG